jgi:heme-degrading monooxygenase HmoA
MHARVSTNEIDPGRIDEAVSGLVERDLPALKEREGFRGLTLLADRSSGKVIGTTYWDSEEQMSAAEEAGEEARRHASETAGATEEWEVSRLEVVHDTFVR